MPNVRVMATITWRMRTLGGWLEGEPQLIDEHMAGSENGS